MPNTESPDDAGSNRKARAPLVGWRFTPKVRRAFLRRLEASPNITAAARATGIHKSTVYYWRNNDPYFGAAMEDILGGEPDLAMRKIAGEDGARPGKVRCNHRCPSAEALEHFLETLAETSNVRESARRHGLNSTTLYRRRRKDADFQRRWSEALAEGYEELEMEMLARARFGVIKTADSPAYNDQVSLRLLIAHRDTVAQQRALQTGLSVEELRDRIDEKIVLMKEHMDADRDG